MTIKSLSSSQTALIMKKGRAYNSGSFLFKTIDINPDIYNETSKTVCNGSFIASKKVFPRAVDRNKSKRRMKEAFVGAVSEIQNTTSLTLLVPPFVFLAKTNIIKEEFVNIVNEIKQILVKDYIIKQ